MSSHGTFVTVLGCMDGRCQEKTVLFAKNLWGEAHVDTITEPGMNKVLAGGEHVVAKEPFLAQLRDWIKTKAGISAKGHGSTRILITGHLQCAGNPVELDEHIEHLRAARDLVTSWALFDEIRLAQFDDNWELQPVE